MTDINELARLHAAATADNTVADEYRVTVDDALSALLAEVEELRKDKERLDRFEALCEHYMRYEGIGIFWDEEDGYFIATVGNGKNQTTLSHGDRMDCSVRECLDTIAELESSARKGEPK